MTWQTSGQNGQDSGDSAIPFMLGRSGSLAGLVPERRAGGDRRSDNAGDTALDA